MFALNHTVLLRGVRATSLVKNVIGVEKRLKARTKKFRTVITLNDLNRSVKLCANHIKKCEKYVKCEYHDL